MYLDNVNLITSIDEASVSVRFSDGRAGLLRFEGVDDVTITSGIGAKHTVELRCDGFTLTFIDDNQLTEADFEGVDELL